MSSGGSADLHTPFVDSWEIFSHREQERSSLIEPRWAVPLSQTLCPT